jgi:hypothetical protein
MNIESPAGLTVLVCIVMTIAWLLHPARNKILSDVDYLGILDFDSWKAEQDVWSELEEMHQTLIDRRETRCALQRLEEEGRIISLEGLAWQDGKTVIVLLYKRVWDDSSPPQWSKAPVISDLTPAFRR